MPTEETLSPIARGFPGAAGITGHGIDASGKLSGDAAMDLLTKARTAPD